MSLGVLSMISGDLPPTATYCRRSWVWIPGGPGGRIGTLTVQLQRGERRGRRTVSIESDSYAVVEDSAPLNHRGAAFLLLNESDPAADEVYQVVMRPEWRCNCKAGLCRVPACKHRESLAAVIEAGGLSSEE